MKRNIAGLTLILFACLMALQIADAKIYEFTLLEKIEHSDLIVLVEFVGGRGTFWTGFKTKLEAIKYARYIDYKVKEVLKGRYNKDILQIDYKKTNEKYEPFICRPPVCSQEDETSVLFLERGMTIFAGFQGKIDLPKDTEKNYVDGLKEIIKIASTKDHNLKSKKLISAFHSDNSELKLMAKEIIIKSWKFKDKEYGTVLIEVLEDNKENQLLRYKAAMRLGDIKMDGIFEVLSKHLYDENQSIRKACVESLGDLGDKRAIPILEEFLQKEKWEPARETGEISIERIKERIKKSRK